MMDNISIRLSCLTIIQRNTFNLTQFETFYVNLKISDILKNDLKTIKQHRSSLKMKLVQKQLIKIN